MAGSITPRVARPARVPLAVAAAATTAAVVVDPDTTHVPLCPFHAATGWDCPLCGSLRAVHALSRGHWLVALQDNVLVVLALLLAPAALLVVRRRGLPSHRRRVATVVAVVVLAVAYTVVRNLDVGAALRPV